MYNLDIQFTGWEMFQSWVCYLVTYVKKKKLVSVNIISVWETRWYIGNNNSRFQNTNRQQMTLHFTVQYGTI